MREIVLDTETTGLSPAEGDRLCEIGCVELNDHLATGRTFHVYINPERDMPEGAFRVHGLSEKFLRDKPTFAEVADDFLEFISDTPLVIHNASFDLGFLNAELKRLGKKILPPSQAVDTLTIARRKFPGAQNNLDALCRRFNIDNSDRVHHGALLDSELLAEVYLELVGGREPGLGLGADAGGEGNGRTARVRRTVRATPLPSLLSEKERAAHTAFIETLNGDTLWVDG